MIKLTAKQLYDLFVHRKDVFSVQSKQGSYFTVRREITLTDIEKHLEGKTTLGVYCLDKDSTVKWACIDLDGTDLDQLKLEAKIIYNQFKDFNRMMEFSGRRGYHVWVFFPTRVTADYAQTMIKARLNRIKMNNHEIFPKQTNLNESRSYGNLVKIPLGKHLQSGKYSEILLFDNSQEIKQ